MNYICLLNIKKQTISDIAPYKEERRLRLVIVINIDNVQHTEKSFVNKYKRVSEVINDCIEECQLDNEDIDISLVHLAINEMFKNKQNNKKTISHNIHQILKKSLEKIGSMFSLQSLDEFIGTLKGIPIEKVYEILLILFVH